MLITIVASAPAPSPFTGTPVYVLLAVPIPDPLLIIVAIFNWPLLEALSLTAELSVLVSQSLGTGIKLVESNLAISPGLMV